MVEYVKELGAELDIFGLGGAEILEDGEIPVRKPGTDADVAAGVAELLDRGLRVRDDLREGGAVERRAGGFWSGIWILTGDEVGTIGGEASDLRCATLVGDIGGIENSERCATHRSNDAVELPSTKDGLTDRSRLAKERQTPLIAEDEAMGSVEQRKASLGREIEGILGEIDACAANKSYERSLGHAVDIQGRRCG